MHGRKIKTAWPCEETRFMGRQLEEIHLTQRISICDSLLKRNEIDPFLSRLITGDENWIVYNEVNRKRSWVTRDEPAQTTPKAVIHRKKIMLFGGIIKEFCTLSFCQETERLSRTCKSKNSPN